MKVRLAAVLPSLLTVGALLLLAILAARGKSGIPVGTPDPDPLPPPQVQGLPIPEPSQLSSHPIAYGLVVLIILISIAVLLGLAMLIPLLTAIRLRRRRRRTRVQAPLDETDPITGQQWLATVTRRALAEMDRKTGGPPSDAVIAAWVHLEESAAATGTPREPHQTPTEFTAAVLAGHAMDEQAVGELKNLYHRARFGEPGSVTQADARRARSALEKIS